MARRFSGQHLRTLRREAGISRTALAATVGCCEHSIFLWERGRVAPSADSLAGIAAALQCSIDDLFVEAEQNGGSDAA